MFIPRTLAPILQKRLQHDSRIVVLYGPRQVGKTTLIRRVIDSMDGSVLFVDADSYQYHDILSSRNLSALQSFVAGYDILFIDEAQRIDNIGITLKLLHDHLQDLRIIVSGSSSLDLAGKISEPLTGRHWTYQLYPIGLQELSSTNNTFELQQQLDTLIRFGSYPSVFSLKSNREREEYLHTLAQGSLYKDVLDLGRVKYPLKVRHLLELLAYQVGNQVSLSELAGSLGIHVETVQHYIDLLERSFIIQRIRGFSRNLRKEVTKMDKIYFYDTGIRNALINNHRPMDRRDDAGPLWENFVLMERMKYLHYTQAPSQFFYWRTYTGAEVDIVEMRDGQLHGYECKWNAHKHVRPPASWLSTYREADYTVITPETINAILE